MFADAYATIRDITSRVDGRTLNGTLVSGNFFHVLGVSASLRRALTPADDARFGGQQVIVLSQHGWARQFDRDPGVIGRTVQVNGAPFQIVGVMPESFRGLEVSPPDYWAPLSLVGKIRPGDGGHEDAVDIEIIGRVRPGLSREQALAELVVWDARSGGADRAAGGARPRVAIQLEPRLGTAPVDEAMWLLGPLFVAFGLILLIGCANVANLLLARAFARQREIGIRLATGASRRRVISQLMTESLLLALISAALGYALSRLLLGMIIAAVMHTMPPDLGDVRLAMPPPDWHVAVFMLAAAMASTMLFALVPALQATRVELVRAIRGEVVRDARPGRTRNVLIAVQVTASVLLLVCSAVFLRSAMKATAADPRIRTADTVTVEIRNEHLRDAMRVGDRRPSTVADWRCRRPVATVGPQHQSRRSRGRRRCRKTARSRTHPPRTPPDRDRRRPRRARLPLPSLQAVDGLCPHRRQHREHLADAASDRRSRTDPPRPARPLRRDRSQRRNVFTLRTFAGMETWFLHLGFWFTLALGILALALTLSGLFSVLSYLVEHRSREIGVRIALGATHRNICLLILRQTARPITLGLLSGLAMSIALGLALLSTPAAAQIAASVHLFDPLAYAASLLFILTACASAASIPALRAGRIDPVATLRRD